MIELLESTLPLAHVGAGIGTPKVGALQGLYERGQGILARSK